MKTLLALRRGTLSAIVAGIALLGLGALSTSARAVDAGRLCAAVKGLSTVTNDAIGGQLVVRGVTFDSFDVDCTKRIINAVETAAVPKGDIPPYVLAVERRYISGLYCPDVSWRGFIDNGWRIETTIHYKGGAETTISVDCAGIPEPTPQAGSPVPDGPGVVVDHDPPETKFPVPRLADVTPGDTPAKGALMPVRTLEVANDAAGNPVILYQTTGLNPDCSRTGALVFRIARQPAHGTLSVIQAPVFPNYPPSNVRSACNSKQVPGYRVVYSGNRHYAGTDSTEFKVFWPDGQAIDVTAPIRIE